MGKLAKMYGILPSEVAARATTYDLMITDILATYESYEYNKAMGQLTPADQIDYTADELKEMMEEARAKHSQ